MEKIKWMRIIDEQRIKSMKFWLFMHLGIQLLFSQDNITILVRMIYIFLDYEYYIKNFKYCWLLHLQETTSVMILKIVCNKKGFKVLLILDHASLLWFGRFNFTHNYYDRSYSTSIYMLVFNNTLKIQISQATIILIIFSIILGHGSFSPF